MRDAMTEFELEAARRPPRRSHRRRGLSGLGLLLVVLGLLAAAVTYAHLPPRLFGLWPLVFVLVGLFGLIRRPGWVEELDLQFGPQAARTLDRPRRLFSLVLVGFGCFCLPFTLGLLNTSWIGPALLVALGFLLLWRRAR